MPTGSGPLPTDSIAPSPSATPATGLPDELAWRQLAAGAGPGPREDQTWTVDPGSGRVAYLFGGRAGADALADLWRYDLDADTWTRLDPPDPRPAARFGHVAVWDETAGLIVWSGQQTADRFFDDVWVYDPIENSWQELPGAGDRPLARYGSCGSIGPDGYLWISHGFTQDDGRFFDTRHYDSAQGRWVDRTPSGQLPVERCLHDCFWTSAGQLLLYAGQTTGVPALADLWSFDPVAGSWTEEARPPAPARQLYALATLADQAYVFGGADIDKAFLGDLWRLDVPSLGWNELTPAGDGPSARSGATMLADGKRGRILLFGGKNGDGEFGDLWELAAATR